MRRWCVPPAGEHDRDPTPQFRRLDGGRSRGPLGRPHGVPPGGPASLTAARRRRGGNAGLISGGIGAAFWRRLESNLGRLVEGRSGQVFAVEVTGGGLALHEDANASRRGAPEARTTEYQRMLENED